MAIDSRAYAGTAAKLTGDPLEQDIADHHANVQRLQKELDALEGKKRKVEHRHLQLQDIVRVLFRMLRRGELDDIDGPTLTALKAHTEPTTVLGAMFSVLVERGVETKGAATPFPTVLINFAIALSTVSKKAYNRVHAACADVPGDTTVVQHKAASPKLSYGCSDKSLLRLQQLAAAKGLQGPFRGTLLNDDMGIQSVS